MPLTEDKLCDIWLRIGPPPGHPGWRGRRGAL